MFYIIITDWMLDIPALNTGCRLLAYGLIYGFSQDGNGYYNGSLDQIGRRICCSRQGTSRILNYLMDEHLITYDPMRGYQALMPQSVGRTEQLIEGENVN